MCLLAIWVSTAMTCLLFLLLILMLFPEIEFWSSLYMLYVNSLSILYIANIVFQPVTVLKLKLESCHYYHHYHDFSTTATNNIITIYWVLTLCQTYLSTLCVLPHLILKITLWSRCCLQMWKLRYRKA